MKNKKRQAWIKVFEEVNSFMEGNLDKWNTIEEIRRTYDEFINNLKKLKDLHPELEHDLTPVKLELAEKRNLLIQKLFPVGNILEVYAEDHHLGKTGLSLVIGKKQVESFSNQDLLDHATRLHKLIDKYMHRPMDENESVKQVSPGQDIKRYGLTQSMMDELNGAGHQFQSALYLRKDMTTYRKKAKKKVEGLIASNRDLLKNRLNKLMSVFSGTHPSFYTEYCEKSRN